MRKGGRKLLVASLGVGAVSYVACGGGNPSPVANLAPPPPQHDASTEHAPDAPADTTVVGQSDVGSPFEFVANLVAPTR
jgi:hypothetical protein